MRPGLSICSLCLMGLLLTLSLLSGVLNDVHAQPTRPDLIQGEPMLSGKIAFTSNRTGKYQIYVMNADGSNLLRVTQDDTLDNFGPYLSPDGQKILYSSGINGTSDYGFKVIDADGLHPAIISKHGEITAAHPQWSPDGARLIFGLIRDNSIDFYLTNADGTNRIKLVYPVPPSVPEVKWVSNTQIILTTAQGLEIGDPDATNLKLVIPNRIRSFALNGQLALEGDFILTLGGGAVTVDIADMKGAIARRQFVLPGGTLLYYLDWSPDGRFIGVDEHDVDPKRQLGGYYIYDVKYRHLFRISTDYWAVWSPDGQYVGYTATDQNGYAQLYVLAPYSTTPMQLTSSAYNNAQPSWSRGSVNMSEF